MNTTQQMTSLQVKSSRPYDQMVADTTVALKAQGFGVLTQIDMQATLKQKLNVDFRRYIILGACNPPLAYRALSTTLDVGLLLPCNVVVYEEGDGSVVTVQDPILMMQVIDNPLLDEIAREARARLEKVIGGLSEPV